MKRYSPERKESVLRKMMPPINMPVSQISRESGISDVTLYKWRSELKNKGKPAPGNGQTADNWAAEDKFAVLLETGKLNEAELSEYCRKEGLYVEQIEAWKVAAIKANEAPADQERHLKEQRASDRKKIKQLEKELNRKEKALAETAALLVLRKKAQAIWGEGEDE
jgi:transposase|tara:strand:+ start:210 stop:707 length:498 start_codon:yes stop_codon:yes gene_type:complete